MFRGLHPSHVDSKGRLKLPAAYARQIDELHDTQFYITSVEGPSIGIFSPESWERLKLEMTTVQDLDPAKSSFAAMQGLGKIVKIDDLGRLLLPHQMREIAHIAGDVIVLGHDTYLKVVAQETFESQIGCISNTDREQLASLTNSAEYSKS